MTSTSSALSGARVLITGGAGLIGSHIVERLLREDVREIVVFDNLSRGSWSNLAAVSESERLTLVEGDVRDLAHVNRVVDGATVVMHLAAIRLTQGIENPRLALDVMVGGTLNVLQAAIEARASRVVFASSSAVYGNPERLPMDERHASGCHTTYGTAKLCGEGLLASLRDTHGLSYVALRPFNVYGPRMDTSGAYTEVFVRWMDRIDRGLPPLVHGDGRQSMDLVYVEDVARAFLLAATAEVEGETFNVATGSETTLNDLARRLLVAMESNLAVEHAPPVKGPIAGRRVGATTRAKHWLGFEAHVSLDDGLKRLVRWWRSLDRPVPDVAPVPLT